MGGELMETAKVDIRKLQLLNDRINQCLDALAQVRLSVHGLASGFGQQGIPGLASPQPGLPWLQGQPQGVPGYLGPQTFAPQPFVSPFFAPQQFLPQQIASPQFAPPFYAQQPTPYPVPQNVGLSHTSAHGQSPGAFIMGSPLASQIPSQIPWTSPIGLSHTNPEEAYSRSPLSDPFVASRIGQTFPYAHFNFSPSLMY